jgi:hypothetical protein
VSFQLGAGIGVYRGGWESFGLAIVAPLQGMITPVHHSNPSATVVKMLDWPIICLDLLKIISGSTQQVMDV